MVPPENIQKLQELIHHPKLVTLNPGQTIRFDLANTSHPRSTGFTVIDYPIQPTTADVAFLIIPKYREADWNFSTEIGHRQLLVDNPQFSRLVLIGYTPESKFPSSYAVNMVSFDDSERRKPIENYFTILVRNYFCPTWPFVHDVTLLPYDKYINMIFRLFHTFKYEEREGRGWIEIVGMRVNDNGIELRRRMSFKESPHIIQTEMLEVTNPIIESSIKFYKEIRRLKPTSKPITGVLVQQNLNAMVKGLRLIATPNLNTAIQGGYKPRCLCVGVGGGALVSFLNGKLDVEVVGVEVGRDVLSAAINFFGLKNGPSVRLIHGNGIDLIDLLHTTRQHTLNWSIQLSHPYRELDEGGQNYIWVESINALFDVIMIDVVTSSIPATAPPLEFMNETILRAAAGILHSEHGVLVINVLRLGQSTYDTLVKKLKVCFESVYKIVVGDNEARNLILIASRTKDHFIDDEGVNAFSARVSQAISEDNLQDMEKI